MSNTEQELAAYIGPRVQDDEIDLRLLLVNLWGGKWWIIGSVLLTAIITFAILKVIKPVYRVSAILDATSPYQFLQVQPSKLIGGEEYQVASVDEVHVYHASVLFLSTQQMKFKFWKEGLNIDLEAEEEGSEISSSYRRFSKNLTVNGPDPKVGVTTTNISLDSSEPQEARDLISAYLNFVSQEQTKVILSQLATAYDSVVSQLNDEYTRLSAHEWQAWQDELTRLRESYSVAKSLGIVETPYEQFENVEFNVLDNRKYLLGTRALGEEIQALEKRQRSEIDSFVPRLRKLQQWIAQVNADRAKLERVGSKGMAFSVLSPSESTLDPIKPKKLLILIATTLAAGFISVFGVLIAAAFKKPD